MLLKLFLMKVIDTNILHCNIYVYNIYLILFGDMGFLNP